MIWVVIDHLTKNAFFLAIREASHMENFARLSCEKTHVPLSIVSIMIATFGEEDAQTFEVF